MTSPEPYVAPKPKSEASQAILGTVYDDLNRALDLVECVYQATHGPEVDRDTGSALRSVLDIAKAKLDHAKVALHGTIAWA